MTTACNHTVVLEQPAYELYYSLDDTIDQESFESLKVVHDKVHTDFQSEDLGCPTTIFDDSIGGSLTFTDIENGKKAYSYFKSAIQNIRVDLYNATIETYTDGTRTVDPDGKSIEV